MSVFVTLFFIIIIFLIIIYELWTRHKSCSA